VYLNVCMCTAGLCTKYTVFPTHYVYVFGVNLTKTNYFPPPHSPNGLPSGSKLLSVRYDLNFLIYIYIYIHTHKHTYRGRDSAVRIATRYGLDGPGIESWWEARLSAPVQTGPGVDPTTYTIVPGLSRG
jgi:hypothetical protein